MGCLDREALYPHTPTSQAHTYNRYLYHEVVQLSHHSDKTAETIHERREELSLDIGSMATRREGFSVWSSYHGETAVEIGCHGN